MTSQHTITAGKSRLVFVDDSLPGCTRRHSGKGWTYFDAAGARISDRSEIERLDRIALPPAYRDAWYCPAGNGHILATGTDERGRKQYRYHPEFRSHREGEKFDSCARFGRLLPLVRQRVAYDLADPKLTRERAIASIVRLLDTGSIRVGNEAYAKANASYGATTLRMRHAGLSGQTLRLRFKAKSGKLCDMVITDKGLTRFVKRMQDLPGQHLFQYLDDAGEACPVDSTDVNAYMRETLGDDFTAKHFRTWHASALGFELIADTPQGLTLKALLGEVSDRLGNTPAVARKSYVHPGVIALLEQQDAWRSSLVLPRKTRWLSRHERGLIDLLENGPSAAALLSAA